MPLPPGREEQIAPAYQPMRTSSLNIPRSGGGSNGAKAWEVAFLPAPRWAGARTRGRTGEGDRRGRRCDEIRRRHTDFLNINAAILVQLVPDLMLCAPSSARGNNRRERGIAPGSQSSVPHGHRHLGSGSALPEANRSDRRRRRPLVVCGRHGEAGGGSFGGKS